MGKNQIKLPACANCGYNFTDENNYCPSCGQKNHDLKIPFKRLMVEVAENTLDIDSKSFKTIKFLLFKPGFLSYEFNTGKRVGYLPPIRLYFLISFIFFLLLNFLSGIHTTNVELNNQHSKAATSRMRISYGNLTTLELAGLTKSQVDSLMLAKKVPPTNFNKWIIYQLYKIANSSSAQFTQLLMKNISYMMFVLMPVFGLMIYLFNRKKINYYIESLIISIHFHSFAFFLFTLIILVIFFLNREIFFLVGIVILPAYMIFMFKYYFKQKMLTTIVKTFFISVFYFMSLIFLFLVTIAVSVILV
jgi:hypothetical protein